MSFGKIVNIKQLKVVPTEYVIDIPAIYVAVETNKRQRSLGNKSWANPYLNLWSGSKFQKDKLILKKKTGSKNVCGFQVGLQPSCMFDMCQLLEVVPTGH